MNSQPILQVEGLTKHFSVKTGFLSKKATVCALNGVTLSINKGETLGLVGESGCGKSTLGRTILKIYPSDAGKIIFEGNNITHLTPKEMQPYRQRMQMIFQDPFASLNPRFTIGELIAEPMQLYNLYPPDEREEQVRKLLRTVGLRDGYMNRYPHEFSGGQRQRVGIARALALNPRFIVCDEPVSALDVSIQAQIINLLMEIQTSHHLSYLFIAHDLTMVRHISHRIGVMYMGSLVEIGDADEICTSPMHPYTQALISAVPIPDPKQARMRSVSPLRGEIPSPLDLPSGCPFMTRCSRCTSLCSKEKPVLKPVSGRQVACHLYNP